MKEKNKIQLLGKRQCEYGLQLSGDRGGRRNGGTWHKECGHSGTGDLEVPDNWAEMTRVEVWEFLEGWLNQDLCHGTKYLLFNSQMGATWPAPKILIIPKFSDLLRLQVFPLPLSRCSMGLCLCRVPVQL